MTSGNSMSWLGRAGLLALALCMAAGPATQPAAKGGPTTQPAAGSKVSEVDQIEFLQKNVQAQMQELQERMYRLAQLTKEAEPGDSAKLILALRRAREELIMEEMKDVLDQLGQKDFNKAGNKTQQVIIKLEKLKELLLSTDLDLQLALERIKKLQGAIAKLDGAIKEERRQVGKSGEMAQATTQPAKALTAAKTDQEQNRKATEAVQQTVKEIGEPATSASPALTDATGAMSKAEGSLGSGKPGDAQGKQGEAVAALQQAREQLEAERQKMLAEIESQVKRQVMENLALMLEKQKSIREANESLAPRLAQGNREAVLRLKALASAETTIANLAESTAQLVEDTEFSFALPPNLRNISRRAIYVTSDLTAGKGDEPVILAEKKIERDIADLIETFNQATSASQGQSRCKGCKGDKNKLLAELKAIRLLQVRVNEETKELDDHRVNLKQLPKAMQEQIGDNRDHQATVRDTLDKLDAVLTDRPPTY
jgi:hypothetical protein